VGCPGQRLAGSEGLAMSPQPKTGWLRAGAVCPHCGHGLDSWTKPKGGPAPKPGDFTVCIECAGLMIYDENDEGLGLVMPTRAQEADATSNRDISQIILAVKIANVRFPRDPAPPISRSKGGRR